MSLSYLMRITDLKQAGKSLCCCRLRCFRSTAPALRQGLASQAVAVLIEVVRVAGGEVELRLFLSLEVLAVVVPHRGRGPRGLGLLRGLGWPRGLRGIRWGLGAFRGFLHGLRGFRLRLGPLVRPQNRRYVRDQVVAD